MLSYLHTSTLLNVTPLAKKLGFFSLVLASLYSTSCHSVRFIIEGDEPAGTATYRMRICSPADFNPDILDEQVFLAAREINYDFSDKFGDLKAYLARPYSLLVLKLFALDQHDQPIGAKEVFGTMLVDPDRDNQLTHLINFEKKGAKPTKFGQSGNAEEGSASKISKTSSRPSTPESSKKGDPCAKDSDSGTAKKEDVSTKAAGNSKQPSPQVSSPREEAEAFIASNDIPALFCVYRDAGNQASDAALLGYILGKRGYKGWNALNSEAQAALIAMVKPAVAITPPTVREEAEAFITSNDIPALFRVYRDAGNQASDAALLGYILAQRGYKGWTALSSEVQAALIAKVKPVVATTTITTAATKKS